MNWTDADGGRFDYFYSQTRGQEGFQDRIWNAEYSFGVGLNRPLTREWYESSEGFGQAQIHVLSIYGGGDPANPDDWVDVTYKPTWEELEAEATKIYEAFSLTDDTITLSPDEESRDGLDVLVDDVALAEVFVNPYEVFPRLELALVPEYEGLQNREDLYGWDDQTQTSVFSGTVSDYSYLDYSLQKPFSTVEELAAYETRIYLNEVREPSSPWSVRVAEGSDPSVVVFDADATDLNGDELVYSVTGTGIMKSRWSLVTIDPGTGEVRP